MIVSKATMLFAITNNMVFVKQSDVSQTTGIGKAMFVQFAIHRNKLLEKQLRVWYYMMHYTYLIRITIYAIK